MPENFSIGTQNSGKMLFDEHLTSAHNVDAFAHLV